jgi:hypothetical protein
MAMKKRAGSEWVGGVISLPGWVGAEDDRDRPEALFWLSDEGAVLGHVLGERGTLLHMAAEHLRDTIQRPLVEKTRAPARVRVASATLAQVLRKGHAGLEIVCAPTPELDEVVEDLRDQIEEDIDAVPPYLSPEVGPRTVGAFFQAAAALFRAQPWKHLRSDDAVFAVTVERLGVRDAILAVIGQNGDGRGFLLFASFDDYEAYLEAAEAFGRDEEPGMPPHLGLTFELEEELSEALRNDIRQHGWEVASAGGHPSLVVVDDDLVANSPNANELTIAEAIALALVRLLADPSARPAVLNRASVGARTLRVTTQAGDVDVTLNVPAELGPPRRDAPATGRTRS